MNYINPTKQTQPNVTHHTFYSGQYGHELGYSIYLPTDYAESGKRYPVTYHLHGWTACEVSDIWMAERLSDGGRRIVVFPNNSPVIEDRESLPVEAMVMEELIPHIDGTYRTEASREGRRITGFSMGGGMAFVYAVKRPDVFSAVTAYAGTYHHYYNKDYRGVGEPPEKAAEIYADMMGDAKYHENDGFLSLIRENAAKIRNRLSIDLRVGTEDILFCDNAVLHMYLASLDIPHDYRVYPGVGHDAGKMVD